MTTGIARRVLVARVAVIVSGATALGGTVRHTDSRIVLALMALWVVQLARDILSEDRVDSLVPAALLVVMQPSGLVALAFLPPTFLALALRSPEIRGRPDLPRGWCARIVVTALAATLIGLASIVVASIIGDGGTRDLQPSVPISGAQGARGEPDPVDPASLLLLGFLLGLGLVAIVGVVIWARRRVRSDRREAGWATGALWDLERAGRRLGIVRDVAETPAEFVRRLLGQLSSDEPVDLDRRISNAIFGAATAPDPALLNDVQSVIAATRKARRWPAVLARSAEPAVVPRRAAR